MACNRACLAGPGPYGPDDAKLKDESTRSVELFDDCPDEDVGRDCEGDSDGSDCSDGLLAIRPKFGLSVSSSNEGSSIRLITYIEVRMTTDRTAQALDVGVCVRRIHTPAALFCAALGQAPRALGPISMRWRALARARRD